MEKCSHSGNEGLLLLASLVSIQIAHQVTNDQLTLLSLFFTVLGDSLGLLAMADPLSSDGSCT